MSIWSELAHYVARLASEAVSGVVEGVRTLALGDPGTRRRVAFSVAIIALSAKMAKADGVVTDDEVAAFREIFHVPNDELASVARLYNLAKQDIAGFESYGKQVRGLFPGDDPADDDILKDVLDALFHIAKADGVVHENELLFLEELAVLFGFDEDAFSAIRLRHVDAGDADPYRILGADPEWSYEQLKGHYRKRAAECHPDRLIARGVPNEFIVIATDRLAALNGAWEAIQSSRRTTRRAAEATAT